jgi:ATP-dependent exoDNAse (exonuclease V) beta subunit
MTELGTTLLVEAGAGTGKTRILVERFINCLRAGAPLSSIVAITFTEKAAGDLRERLTARLEKLLAGDVAGSPQLDLVERERLVQAFDEIDTAAVSTIHSFAGRLLRERPVEAGVDPAFRQLDELGSELLLSRLWRDWLEAAGDDGGQAAGKQALTDALSAGVTLASIQTIAAEHFGRRHGISAGSAAPEFAAAAVVEELRSWVGPLRAATASCRDREDKLCTGIHRLADAIEGLAGEADTADAGWQIVAIAQKRTSFGAKGAGQQGSWPGGKDDPLSTRDEAFAAAADAADRFKEYLAGLTGAAARGFCAFASARQLEAGVLDFDDLLGRARDLLAGRALSSSEARRVREFFQKKYRYLLVDEFQDTDPLQVEIVMLLAAADPEASDWQTVRLTPGKLFLVGDPKQSIYRFRNADIAIFQHVKRLVRTQGDVLEIQQNFRTLPGIVDWVNGAFAEIIGSVDEDLKPRYLPIFAYRADPTAEQHKVNVLRPPAPLDEWKADEVRAAEAKALAGLFSRFDDLGWTVRDPLHTDAPPRPAHIGDVTILFRTFTGIDFYERALRDAGIPYRVEGGRSFFQRPEVVDVVAGLRAIDVPGDELAVYAALHGSLFGLPDEDLYAFHAAGGRFDLFAEGSQPGFAAVEEALAMLRELLETKPMRSISYVVNELVRRARLREVLAADGGGAQASGNIEKLLELADAFSAEEEATFHSYVRKLGELQARAEEGESPVGEAGEFVRLMSIHKAKGLEFPMVVLADTGGQPRSVSYSDVVVDRAAGRLLFGVKVEPPDGAAGAAQCHLPGDERLRCLEADARAFEGRRLLYVAATRAMDRLIIPVVADAPASDGSFLEQLLPFLFNGDGLAEGVAELLAPPTGDRAAAEVDAPPADLLARRVAWAQARTEALTAASLPALVTSPSRLELLDPPEAGLWDALPPSEDALALGHLVHSIMERVPLDADGRLGAIAEEEALESGRPDLAHRARCLAAACWASAPVREAAARRHWKEVPVSAAIDGVLLEGYVDLLYAREDGLVVIDFKTDRDADVEAAERRYGLQLGAYALALEAATGRRVCDSWIVMAAGGDDGGPGPSARVEVDDALRERVRVAAREAAAAGRPLVETLLP